MLPLPYHKMVTGMLKSKASSKPSRAAKPRKNAIKPSRASIKLKYYILIETAPGTWKHFAAFLTRDDAIEYARAFHKRYPAISVQVDSAENSAIWPANS